MGLGHTKTTVTPGVEVFKAVHEVAQGGFTLATTPLTAGETIARGTPMGYDESTRYASVVKQAILYENATDATINYKVKKGHSFKVGDVISFVVGGAAKAITAITTSATAYDTIGVGSGNSLGVAITAGEVLFEAETAGADTGALKVEPKGLLYTDVVVGDNEPCTIVTLGTVYARRITTGACDAVRSALAKITFSESK